MRQKCLFILIIIIHLFFLIYLKFTAWPEMTLWPYLIIKGWLPYHDIAIAHTPLMLIFLAIFYDIIQQIGNLLWMTCQHITLLQNNCIVMCCHKIAGVGILQLKIFTWAVILGLDVLIYWIVKKLWNVKTALIALTAFTFWQLVFDGNELWFDLFMGAATLTAYYFVQKKKYFWSGIFLTLAFISKQTAVWFVLPIAWQIVRSEKFKVKSLLNFIYGGLIVSGVFVLSLAIFRILPDFYYWAIKFGLFILPKAQGQVQLPDLKNLAVSFFPFLVFIPLVFRTRTKNINLLFWALAGSLGAYPRFEYFHFQPAIPFLAIAIANFFTNVIWKNPFIKIFTILYIMGSLYLFSGFFIRNFNEGTRFYEQDVQDIVSYVESNTNSSDKIFVMNWWDNIYSLSDRLPGVDPWVPQLSWYTELPGIQEKMVSDLTQSKPKLIILNKYSEIGLSAYIPQKVYTYVTANYKLKTKVDGISILILNK